MIFTKNRALHANLSKRAFHFFSESHWDMVLDIVRDAVAIVLLANLLLTASIESISNAERRCSHPGECIVVSAYTPYVRIGS